MDVITSASFPSTFAYLCLSPYNLAEGDDEFIDILAIVVLPQKAP